MITCVGRCRARCGEKRPCYKARRRKTVRRSEQRSRWAERVLHPKSAKQPSSEGGKQLEDRPWLHLILDELPRFVWIHFASGNAMNSNLQRRLKALADNFKGPLGPIPLDRAVRRHRGLFEEFRDEGFTWSQIARALAAAGIRRADGSSFSADRLRGAVSRQMKVTASAPTGPPAEDSTPLRTAAPEEKASSGPKTGETAAPRARKTVAVKPLGVQKPDQPTAVSRSIQDKLSRVAKLRGG